MGKDDAVRLLNEQGYEAENIDGVVTVYLPPETDADKFEKGMSKLLRDSGYGASYGIRSGKGGRDE